MAGKKFSYGHRLFLFRTIYISIFFISILVFLATGTDTGLYIGVFSVLFAICILVFGISPIMTSHEITDENLVLRQGIFFSIRIPWPDIDRVEKIEYMAMGYGVTASITKSRISVATGKYNLVMVYLKDKKRFGSVLGKLADEILLDVDEYEAFVKEALEKLSGF